MPKCLRNAKSAKSRSELWKLNISARSRQSYNCEFNNTITDNTSTQEYLCLDAFVMFILNATLLFCSTGLPPLFWISSLSGTSGHFLRRKSSTNHAPIIRIPRLIPRYDWLSISKVPKTMELRVTTRIYSSPLG